MKLLTSLHARLAIKAHCLIPVQVVSPLEVGEEEKEGEITLKSFQDNVM